MIQIFQGNGKIFKIDSSKKPSRFQYDACGCIIIYDNNLKHLETQFKCNLHKSFDGQKLLDTVIKHNQSFNLKFGRGEQTKQQMKIIGKDKGKELERIKKL